MTIDIKYLELISEEIKSLKRILIEKEKPFLTMDEASTYMGLPKNTLYQYTSKNLLPYYKTGKRVYFKIEELNEFILNENNRYPSIKEITRERDRNGLAKYTSR